MTGRSTTAILERHRRDGPGARGRLGLIGPVTTRARGTDVREALSGLTVRGRAFVAAGISAIVCAMVLGEDSLVRVGRARRRAPPDHRRLHRPQPLPARAGPDRHPAAGRGRPAGPGAAGADQRGPHPERAAAARGPGALRARRPAALRARGDRPRLASPCDLPGPLRRARSLRDRADERAGQRPVRDGRARPIVPDLGAADRHPADRRRSPRSRSAARGPAPATTGPARSPPERRGRHRARVPPRRRPAPRALAQLGPRRRADGAPRGAAVAVARHGLPRQPHPRPPRPGHRVVAGVRRLRRGLDRGAPEPARLHRPARHRHRRGPRDGVALPRGRSSTPARCSRRSPSSSPPRTPSSTWGGSAESAHGGLVVAVLGGLDSHDQPMLRRMLHHAGSALADRARRRAVAVRGRRPGPAPTTPPSWVGRAGGPSTCARATGSRRVWQGSAGPARATPASPNATACRSSPRAVAERRHDRDEGRSPDDPPRPHRLERPRDSGSRAG